MNAPASKSVMLEMKLKRHESQALLGDLNGRPDVRINVHRARLTARDAWYLIEISGRERDVNEAVRATRRRSAAGP